MVLAVQKCPHEAHALGGGALALAVEPLHPCMCMWLRLRSASSSEWRSGPQILIHDDREGFAMSASTNMICDPCSSINCNDTALRIATPAHTKRTPSKHHGSAFLVIGPPWRLVPAVWWRLVPHGTDPRPGGGLPALEAQCIASAASRDHIPHASTSYVSIHAFASER